MSQSNVHYTDSIAATVDVEGTDFKATEVEIDRSTMGKAGMAKIKGFVDDSSDIGKNLQVSVEFNDKKMFNGRLRRATMDDAHLLTITAYDIMYEMHQYHVTVNPEDPVTNTKQIQDIISDNQYIKSHVNIQDPGKGLEDDEKARRIFNEVPLSKALDILTKNMGKVMWVDKENVLQISTAPPDRRLYDIVHITEIGSGDGGTTYDKTLVKGSGGASTLGLSGQYVQDTVTPSGVAENDNENVEEYGQINKNNKPTKRLDEDNIKTPKEAQKRATVEQVRENQKATTGKVTLVGFVDLDIWDGIRITELPDSAALGEGLYEISSVKHVLNAKDGYTTQLSVQNPYDKSIEMVGELGPAGESIKNTLLGEWKYTHICSRNEVRPVSEEENGGTDTSSTEALNNIISTAF